jgi:hypothetical protein
MTDVLKLAEEALELVRGEVEHPMTTQSQEAYVDALAAIRAARAECGWRPIAEMADHEAFNQATILGRWGWWYGQPPERWCFGNCGHMSKSEAIKSGYTHFYRPQLPPPPAREEVGNG